MLLTGMFICYLYVFYCIVEEQPGASSLQQAQHGMYCMYKCLFYTLYKYNTVVCKALFKKLQFFKF